MNQNIKGITSKQKNHKFSNFLKRKSNSPQVRKFHSPKGIKINTLSKQNSVSPQTQPFTEINAVQQQYKKVQPSKNVKQQIKCTKSKYKDLTKEYFAENPNNQSSQKFSEYQKDKNLSQEKYFGSIISKGKIEEKSPMFKLNSSDKVKFEQKKTLKLNQYIQNLSGQYLQKPQNQQALENEYKKKKEMNQENKQFPFRLKKNNSISSNSSKKSYYGIVAEYRKKRLQKSNIFSQGKMSLQNSVTDSMQENSQKMLIRRKSQEFTILKSFLSDRKGIQNRLDGEKKYGFRPRINTSASSKSSIKSSQSNLSNSSKNLIQKKVTIMKNHLKERKPSTNLSNKNNFNPKKNTEIEVEYRVKHYDENQFLQVKEFDFQKFNRQDLLDYKELYQKSINKLKTVTKQLEVQKKKNQITRQIYKSEIQKLKRNKSSQNINENYGYFGEPNQKVQENQYKCSFQAGNSEIEKVKSIEKLREQKNNNQGTVMDLKNKLRNSHLFTYQAFQSITKGNISSQSKRSSFKSAQQKSANSILMPNQLQQNLNDESQNMIVELSQELRDSAMYTQTMWKSKISQKYKFQDLIKSSRQKSHISKESILLPELSFKKNSDQFQEVRQVTFNQLNIFQSNNNELKTESFLLDLSSNFSNTKSFYMKQDQNNDEETILLDSFCLETKECKTQDVFESKKTDEYKIFNTKNKVISFQKTDNRNKNGSKRVPIKINFVQDSLKKGETKNSQTEYDSTSSSTVVRNKDNLKKMKTYFQD